MPKYTAHIVTAQDMVTGEYIRQELTIQADKITPVGRKLLFHRDGHLVNALNAGDVRILLADAD